MATIRRLFLILSALAALPLRADAPAKAAPTVKPPWQRYLQGDDAKMAADMQGRQQDLQVAGRFEDALNTAEALAHLRSAKQGADHWQAVNAHMTVTAIRLVLRAPKEYRDQYTQAFATQREASTLFRRGRYREAQPLLEKLLAIRQKVLGEEHSHTADTYGNAAIILDEQRKWAEAEKAQRKALAIRRKVLGQDHPNTANSYSDLAINLNAQRKYAEAEQAHRSALAICRKVFGEDHSSTADNHNSLADNLNAQRKYAEAEESYRKALVICSKLPGEDQPNPLQIYKNLIANLFSQRKYVEAAELQRNILALCRSRLGEDHPDTASGYNNLAMILFAQAKFTEAEEGLRKALAIRRKAFGENHADTANTYSNLALNLKAQARYAEAEEGFHKALAIRRKILGEDHPDTASSYNDLAKLYLVSKVKYAEAEAGLQKALAIRRKVFGEDDIATAESYNSTALNLKAQGKYDLAEESFRRALAIHRKVLGEDHAETAQSYADLASNLSSQGRYAESEEAARNALAIIRKALGEDHPDTAQSYNHLASILNEQARYAEAADFFRRAMAIHEKSMRRDDDVGSAIIFIDVANNLSAQGEHDLAEKGYHHALAIIRKVRGDDDIHTANTYSNLAMHLNDQGKFAEAEEGLRKVLSIRRKALGEDHPHTATGYSHLACNLGHQARYAEADEGLRKALAISRKVLGEEHPQTVSSYHNVAHNLNAWGKYAEAEAFWLTAADSFAKSRLHIAATGLDRAAKSSERSPLPGLAAVLARNGKAEAAWQRLEENLGRGTWDDLSARLRRPAADQAKQTQLVGQLDRLDKLIEGTLSVKQASAEAKQRRDEWLTQRRKVQDELDAFASHLEQTYGPAAGQIFDRQQIQASLSGDTALVGWLDLGGTPKAADPNGEHWAFLLRSKGEPVVVRLRGSGPKRPPQADHAPRNVSNGSRHAARDERDDSWTEADARLPAELRAALQSPRGDWRSLAQRLYKQRLAPLEKYLAAGNGLPAVRRLVVLPSTALAGIPVEVLANDGAVVSYAPSGTLYAHQRKQPSPKTNGLLALADPVFDRPKSSDPPSAPVPPSGVLLTIVTPDGNAAQAQLKPGDVLLRYADAKLTGTADLDKQIAAHEKDQCVTVRVWREGQEFDRAVRPGKLGVVLASDPAPKAVAGRRKTDEWLASRGGDNEKWEQLPGTRIEVQALRRLFDRSHHAGRDEGLHQAERDGYVGAARVLADSDASEQQLYDLTKSGELGKYRYLHLATHGVVDDRFPLRSAVILSRDKLPDPGKQLDAGLPIFDGSLTAEEVLRNWNLNAELVTLSACQTGLGKYERGEGFVGFAQALLLSGSRSVCLSMWKVDDAATALLMTRFYENLLGKRTGLKSPMKKAEALAEAKAWLRGLSRDEALQRAAQLTSGVARGKGRPALPLLPAVPKPAPQANGEPDRPYAHPYYWAAFVLIGDPE